MTGHYVNESDTEIVLTCYIKVMWCSYSTYIKSASINKSDLSSLFLYIQVMQLFSELVYVSFDLVPHRRP